MTLLPVHSKIYEKVLAEQLSEHFEGIFDKYLCACRKGHGCQTTLLRLILKTHTRAGNSLYLPGGLEGGHGKEPLCGSSLDGLMQGL